jgi:aspartate oxidase
MSRHVGVLRDEMSLSSATGALGSIARGMRSAKRTGDVDDVSIEPSRRTWEGTNILTVATAVVAAARTRHESRGCHRRSDYPEPRAEWLRHLDVTLDATGALIVGDRAHRTTTYDSST